MMAERMQPAWHIRSAGRCELCCYRDFQVGGSRTLQHPHLPSLRSSSQPACYLAEESFHRDTARWTISPSS